MEEKNLWLKRLLLGGVIAVAAVLALTFLINFILSNISILGSAPHYSSIQLTFDRCVSRFGSAAIAVAVEYICVFALGGAIGLATLPFAETWTNLLGPSLLHFFVTGGLSLLVGWSYGWFGFAPADGTRIIFILYLTTYILIWGIRWILWYRELCRMRKALNLPRKEP